VRKLEHPELVPSPQNPLILTQMTEVQRMNLAFMLQCETRSIGGGLLLDDMGLGKTLSALALIVNNFERQSTLVIVPKNVLYGWEKEIRAHIQPGVLKYSFYYGPQRKKQPLHHSHIVLSTYTTIRDDYDKVAERFHPDSMFGTVVFDRLILDEAHVIRNRNTAQCKAVSQIMAEKRWCMTGTPVWNKLEDLYGMFQFIRAFPLADYTFFKRNVLQMVDLEPRRVMDFLCDRLLYYAIRHSKQLHLSVVKQVHEHYLTFSVEEASRYAQLKKECKERMNYLLNMYENFEKNHKFGTYNEAALRNVKSRLRFHILGAVTKLRQAATCVEIVEPLVRENYYDQCIVCLVQSSYYHVLRPCGHTICSYCSALEPELCPRCLCCIQATEDHSPMEDSIQDAPISFQLSNDRLHTLVSAKTRFVLDLLEAHHSEKFVIFSVWIKYLDALEHWITRAGVKCIRIQGAVSAARRIKAQDQFTNDPGTRVILCSMTATSVGLNLQASSRVIVCDVYWNDACIQQAVSRVERLGQRNSVVDMYHLYVSGTIDEQMRSFVTQKSEVAMTAISGTTDKTDTMTWANNIRLMMRKIFN
jgi:SNF2 family DNA or RNA helicase